MLLPFYHCLLGIFSYSIPKIDEEVVKDLRAPEFIFELFAKLDDVRRFSVKDYCSGHSRPISSPLALVLLRLSLAMLPRIRQ